MGGVCNARLSLRRAVSVCRASHATRTARILFAPSRVLNEPLCSAPYEEPEPAQRRRKLVGLPPEIVGAVGRRQENNRAAKEILARARENRRKNHENYCVAIESPKPCLRDGQLACPSVFLSCGEELYVRRPVLQSQNPIHKEGR